MESSEKAAFEADGNNHSSTMNLYEKHNSRQMISIMHIITINSTPINQICTFCRGLAHVVENCPSRSNQILVFMIELIFGTTQPTILVSSQILIIQVPIVFKHNLYFTVAPSYLVIQMLNNQYLTMNRNENNILPAYLGNYGPSYKSNDNIPNQWIMIPNLYYLGNPPLTFSNTTNPTTYLFPKYDVYHNCCNWRKSGC